MRIGTDKSNAKSHIQNGFAHKTYPERYVLHEPYVVISKAQGQESEGNNFLTVN